MIADCKDLGQSQTALPRIFVICEVTGASIYHNSFDSIVYFTRPCHKAQPRDAPATSFGPHNKCAMKVKCVIYQQRTGLKVNLTLNVLEPCDL